MKLMDVEKTIQFLLEQEAVFASRMDELATNLVAIGKAQARYDQYQENFERRHRRLQDMQVNHEERIQRLEEAQRSAAQEVRDLGRSVKQLVDLVRGGFETNGSGS